MPGGSFEDMLLSEFISRNMRKRRRRERPNFFNLQEAEFFDRFRMSKNSVRLLVQQLNLPASTGRNNALMPDEKVLLTLQYFASASFLICIGDFAGVNKGTASRIIAEVSSAIARLAVTYIKMPLPDEQREEMKIFYNICGFPLVIGLMDGTLTKIASPGGDNAELYRGRKGWFAMNVQIVCDSSMKIRNIVARYPGSVHDQTVYNGSFLRLCVERGDLGQGVILGDGGYACTNKILTTFRNPTTRGQRIYNRKHKQQGTLLRDV